MDQVTLSRGEQKSLAYHYAVAEKLRADPALIDVAKRRVQWYRNKNPAGASYYNRWSTLLAGPLGDLIDAMLDPSSDGSALRQENPFVDVIDQRERAAIYRRVVERIDAGTST